MTYVEGPIFLAEYKNKTYNKHFYLFGDLHTKEKVCPTSNVHTIGISDFIKQTINDNSDKVIDFFIEINVAHTDREKTISRKESQFG